MSPSVAKVSLSVAEVLLRSKVSPSVTEVLSRSEVLPSVAEVLPSVAEVLPSVAEVLPNVLPCKKAKDAHSASAFPKITKECPLAYLPACLKTRLAQPPS